MDGLFAAVPWLIAAAALALTIVAIRHDIRWKRAEKLQTTAEIVGIDERTDNDGATTYAARYRFRTIDGRTVETSDNCYAMARPAVGRSVALWYDRARPETVFHNPRGMGVWTYLFLAVFNAAMIGFAWLFTRFAEG